MVAFMRYVSVTARCSGEYRNERFKELGLCGFQYTYITHLCRHPGVSQEELSHIIHVNKSNVTRQLTALEEKGFVERRTSAADKRVTEVYPTQKAYDALPLIHEVLHDWNNYLTEGFTEEERQTLSDLMARVSERAVEYIENGGGNFE